MSSLKTFVALSTVRHTGAAPQHPRPQTQLWAALRGPDSGSQPPSLILNLFLESTTVPIQAMTQGNHVTVTEVAGLRGTTWPLWAGTEQEAGRPMWTWDASMEYDSNR